MNKITKLIEIPGEIYMNSVPVHSAATLLEQLIRAEKDSQIECAPTVHIIGLTEAVKEEIENAGIIVDSFKGEPPVPTHIHEMHPEYCAQRMIDEAQENLKSQIVHVREPIPITNGLGEIVDYTPKMVTLKDGSHWWYDKRGIAHATCRHAIEDKVTPEEQEEYLKGMQSLITNHDEFRNKIAESEQTSNYPQEDDTIRCGCDFGTENKVAVTLFKGNKIMAMEEFQEECRKRDEHFRELFADKLATSLDLPYRMIKPCVDHCLKEIREGE